MDAHGRVHAIDSQAITGVLKAGILRAMALHGMCMPERRSDMYLESRKVSVLHLRTTNEDIRHITGYLARDC